MSQKGDPTGMQGFTTYVGVENADKMPKCMLPDTYTSDLRCCSDTTLPHHQPQRPPPLLLQQPQQPQASIQHTEHATTTPSTKLRPNPIQSMPATQQENHTIKVVSKTDHESIGVHHLVEKRGGKRSLLLSYHYATGEQTLIIKMHLKRDREVVLTKKILAPSGQ